VQSAILQIALLLALGAPAAAGDLAVIVHPGNPLGEVSATELRAMFLQDRLFWADGGRIYLVLPAAGTREKRTLLSAIYRRDDAALQKFWLEKLYRGEITAFPRVAPSSPAARLLVARARYAISVAELSSVDGTVKVLRIDGRSPGEPGYLLAGR
jgi:hypothetical protein